MKRISILYILLCESIFVYGQSTFRDRLSDAALGLTKQDVVYDPSYFRIPYPNGDVPSDRGVCQIQYGLARDGEESDAIVGHDQIKKAMELTWRGVLGVFNRPPGGIVRNGDRIILGRRIEVDPQLRLVITYGRE